MEGEVVRMTMRCFYNGGDSRTSPKQARIARGTNAIMAAGRREDRWTE